MKIYHNPRCRKSRETLNILVKNHIKVEIVEYLKFPLDKIEIKHYPLNFKGGNLC